MGQVPHKHKGRCLVCGQGMRRVKRDGSVRQGDICYRCLKWIRKRREDNDGRI